MKSVKYACALVALGLASQASADTYYGWCRVHGASKPQWANGQPTGHPVGAHRYLSGIVEVPDGPERRDFDKSAFAKEFHSYVGSIHSERIGSVRCGVTDTLLSAREGLQMKDSSDIYVRTGWLGGRAAAVDRGPKRSAPAEELHLAFPSKKSPADAGDAAERRKKTNAEADAEYALKLAQYNREMGAWREKVAERDRLEAEGQRKLAEAAEAARKAKAEHEQLVARCKSEGRCAVTKQ